MDKCEPFLRLAPPSADHRFVGVVTQPGTDIVLAAFSREAKMKELTEEEVMEAADRFLQPALVAERRKYFLEFGIEDLKDVPNSAEEERVKRGVTEEITTVEQWKRLLPDSYQEVLAYEKRYLKIDFEIDLQSGFSFSFSLARYRNIEEYKVWLNSLKLGPETVFEVVRHGGVAARSRVAGYLPDTIDGFAVAWPLAFRAVTGGVCVVLPLDPTPSVELEKQRTVFSLASFPWETL
jgi:hypothetical protein